MKKILITSLLFLFSYLLFSNNNYEKNADAVIEEYNHDFYIDSPKNAKLKVYIRIKVLNKNGDEFAEFAEYYDPFKRILFFDGKIYDSTNKRIRRIGMSDLNDNSLINNFSTYEDNRIKTYSPNIRKYPYTVEYSYQITYNGILNIPRWQPQFDYNLAVLKSRLKVYVPKDLEIKYKNYNIDNPTVITEKNKTVLSWETSDLEAIEYENHHIRFSNFAPTIYLAPNNFKIGNYEGNMSSWESFGNWINDLIKDQYVIPDKLKTEIDNLITNDTNKIEIAKKIYRFVQNNTRYVSIQLGIGGWKPFSANEVYNLGYGDCKALTNYTKALLSYCNIDSHYALIKAGKYSYDIDTSFPSNQFNHAILCLPIDKDTVWLECTSQTAPFGYLGNFTDNRHALIIKENKSKIVKTISYNSEKNIQIRKANISINNLGNVTGKINTFFSGVLYENVSYMMGLGKERQQELLYKKHNINNLKINNFKIGVNRQRIPTAMEYLTVEIPKYSTISGSRLFLSLNLMNKSTYIPKEQDNRISPIKINTGYHDIDSIRYTYPDKFAIEYIPNDISIKNSFGEYNIKMQVNKNEILYIRNLIIYEGIYPASEYNNFYSFFADISKFDKSKCILKKKEL